jgi:hypothetical protein
MRHARTRLLLAAATLISGILAGAVFDRVVVGSPAWHALGAEAWEQYSRRADLGAGLVAYPVEGIGATLLIVAAAVSHYFDGGGRRGIAIPLIFAVVFSLIGLLFTVKAAPIMLALATPQAPAALQRAFDEFFFWGLYCRGAADTLAFVASVWALSVPAAPEGNPALDVRLGPTQRRNA